MARIRVNQRFIDSESEKLGNQSLNAVGVRGFAGADHPLAKLDDIGAADFIEAAIAPNGQHMESEVSFVGCVGLLKAAGLLLRVPPRGGRDRLFLSPPPLATLLLNGV